MKRTDIDSRARAALAVVLLLLAAAVPLSRLANRQQAVAAAAVNNWGLSFQTEGRTPQGNATAAELKKYDAYFCGEEDQPVIYLTFDAGYENGYTAQILDVLQAHNAPAAFFLVGNYLQQEPELVQRMLDEGHIVGNHTWSHPDIATVQTREALEEQLTRLEDLFREVTGREMSKYYRPPQGKYSQDNLELAQSLGYTTVFWSLAYVDWYENDQPTRDQAFAKLIPRIHNGAVVLLHSTSRTNAEILDELLTAWEDLGYRFGTLDELTQPGETDKL